MNPFHELFVLELASNHWGCLKRGIAIVRAFAPIVRQYGVRAAIKLQFRDVPTFVHKDHRADDARYIRKVLATEMPWRDYKTLVDVVRTEGLVAAATPFDEKSVDKCVEFGLDFIKIASSDINDWTLLDAVKATGKPVIVSTGGAKADEVYTANRMFADVPAALNHCVSIYPSEHADLCLNQIDVLRRLYPNRTIGFSTHEYRDWQASMFISYAKGARTWERHIDVTDAEHKPSPYSTTPAHIREWFEAFLVAKEMCGSSDCWRKIPEKEAAYLRALRRGVYAKRELKAGEPLRPEDVYLAIPAQEGQMDCTDPVLWRVDGAVEKDGPIWRNA